MAVRSASVRFGFDLVRFGLVCSALVTLGTVRMGLAVVGFLFWLRFVRPVVPFIALVRSFVQPLRERTRARLHRVRFIVNEMPIETPQSNSTKCA